MKKILSFLLLISLIGVFFTPTDNYHVQAIDASFTTSGTTALTGIGGYIATSEKESNNLPYGVKQYTHLGQSTTYDSQGVPGALFTQQVNVLEVPSTEGVKIVSWGFLDDHRWTLKTVRNLIHDFEEKNPGWIVIGGINGDFFDIGAMGNLPYQTSGAHGAMGDFYKTSSSRTIGFPNDGTENSLIGDVTAQRTTTMKLGIYDANDEIITTFDVESYNRVPNAGQTSVYYGIYDSDKVYVPIQMSAGAMNGYLVGEAELALPNNANDFYGRGTISTATDSANIGRGQFGLISDNPEVNAALEVGVRIRVQWEFRGAFANAESVTGVGQTFLKENEYLPGTVPHRHPRTIIGRKADGTILMIVVDGRQATIGMNGMIGHELAAVMRRYGAVEAYNLDGGGSSTLMIRDGDELRVMNSPSDGWERTDANGLLVVARDPNIQMADLQATTTSLSLNFNVLDNGGHDMDNLFVRIGTTTVQVEDGVANFTGLRANTEYTYTMRYQDKSGRFIDLKDLGTVYTQKAAPTFRKVLMVEQADSFIFSMDFTDRANAGNFATAPLWVNGHEYHFSGGLLTVLKADVGDSITSLNLEYTVDLNNNMVTKYNIMNPQYYATMALNRVVDSIKESVSKIYE